MKRKCILIIIAVLTVVLIKQAEALTSTTDPAASRFLPGSQATPAPAPNTRADDAQYLAELKQRLVGHEEEPAETFFKNIEILKGKKASRLPAMMSALTGLLGVGCSYCHIPNEWAREDKPTKQTARKMFRMIGRINKEDFAGKNAVSCWTCHRGNPHPPIQ